MKLSILGKNLIKANSALRKAIVEKNDISVKTMYNWLDADRTPLLLPENIELILKYNPTITAEHLQERFDAVLAVHEPFLNKI